MENFFFCWFLSWVLIDRGKYLISYGCLHGTCCSCFSFISSHVPGPLFVMTSTLAIGFLLVVMVIALILIKSLVLLLSFKILISVYILSAVYFLFLCLVLPLLGVQ